jgi:predicted TIM-barrel fold metal-dependent hydrolase
MIIDSHNLIHPDLQPPEKLLSDMDRAGVDMAVIYCRHDYYFDNNYTALAVKQHPDRFIGLAYINPTRETGPTELERALELGLSGILLDPKYDDYSLSIASHWFMDQVFSYCDTNKLILVVEGWGDSHNSMPYQFRDVAWHFPDLVIIMVHMSMMGGYDDVHRVASLCPNVYLNTSTTTTSQVNIAVRRAGAEKVLLGTSTPVEYLEVGLKKVEVGVPDASQRLLVLGTNAQRLFKIP